MNSPDKLSPEDNELSLTRSTTKIIKENNYAELREQALENFQKPNLPNVNIPEKVVICLDTCYDDHNSLYRLGDGTTFTPICMLKRVLNFFVYSKHAINKKTEFALILLKNCEACLVHGFTENVKDIISSIDYVNGEECNTTNFDFKNIYTIIKDEIEIPEYKQSECMNPPPYIVRLLVLYGRSNCIPTIDPQDPYLIYLKKQMFFYIDILFAHEEECSTFKCEEIYDALQDLDNGYSFVFEVSRNATKIHDSIAKLLAHPLQRPLQKHTDYSFGSRG